MHWGTIAIRGLWPAAGLMTATTALALLVQHLGSAWPSWPFDGTADWIFSAGWLAAAGWSAVFVLRLKRWEAGKGPCCGFCGGPTGRVRPGPVAFGRRLADYRRCYNCGRATPEVL